MDQIETVTLGQYNQIAEAFPKDKNLDILDLGCRPGRDVNYFHSLRNRPIGLVRSEVFCAMARSYTGFEILHQKFLSMKLPIHAYDDIFANASLFYVPSQQLQRILDQLHVTLRPSGILFLSNARGDGED